MPRHNAARFIRPLVAARHVEAVLVGRIIREIFGMTFNAIVVIFSGFRVDIQLRARYEGEKSKVSEC